MIIATNGTSTGCSGTISCKATAIPWSTKSSTISSASYTTSVIAFTSIEYTVDVCCKDAWSSIIDTWSVMNLGLRTSTIVMTFGDTGASA